MRLVSALWIGMGAASLLAQQLPSTDELIARYVQALGGREALMKVTSRRAQGSIESPTYGSRGGYEEQAKAPDLFVRAFQVPNYGVVQLCSSGRAGWSETPEYGVEEISGKRWAELRREAQFDWPLKIRELYPGLKVRGRERMLDREVIVAGAALPEGGEAKLFFDAETGLLQCVDAPETARDGSSRTVRTCYEDYRDVGGVQVAHTVRFESADLILIVKRNVALNVPVDEKRFERP